jgi:hypothetical protein
VRVISGLADVDFNVHAIAREGPFLVVRAAEGAGLPTVVYVSPRDIVAALKALLRSPAAFAFVLTAPFRSRGASAASAAAGPVRDDVNNPWT